MITCSKDWTLFLDRDGVINQRNFDGYIEKPEDFFFEEGALEALLAFSQLFQRVVVVTNQQGVGKGIMTARNLSEVHTYMLEEVEKAGAKIDHVFYSADLKTQENNSRKPNPTMGYWAQEMFPEIDFKKSIMVGDTNGDIQFGKKLGMTTVLIKSKEEVSEQADFEFNSLLELAKNIQHNA
ncbi:D-glycero-D-manno-heptose 1,7-bisphosphate phosphatase/D-glycero-alpha-D-manno-heptose 1-phosphate guanylyltransferase [Lishizhenia tianjinensis]|uniref:D,D-heptose 1,7-bisphosphate phosphatase n=1 Tax=Lishizhenia tianjinensis TaxID=477690 RepID=A0A1I6Y4U0_9FLAO|nr:HAD-IIIA family hydrolase [Lishizhenia tianjinensis]SFT45251.1 D-glycero-D-manno-heptose 1,7-bisphosphate phosphatase/D-glycero-alpha-D-manno-heptose 1-phosphate guanylyltransferase [Lishizhenia tianjinensis]